MFLEVIENVPQKEFQAPLFIGLFPKVTLLQKKKLPSSK